MNNTDIAQRIAQAGPNREVVLPDGTYNIDQPVRPLFGQSLRSASSGGANFVLKADCSLVDLGVSGVQFRGIRFNGAYDWKSRSGPKGKGIFAHDVSGLRIIDCWGDNLFEGGFVMTKSRDVKIIGNVLNGCGSDGLGGTPSIFGNFDAVDHVVTDNTITMRKGGPHGIGYHTERVGYTQRRIRIDRNRLHNSGAGYCIEVGSFASGGGDAERPTDIDVVRNIMTQDDDCCGGISFDFCDSVHAEYNSLRASKGTANAGIECVKGRRVRLVHNEVYGAGQISIGIALDHELEDGIISFNRLYDMDPRPQRGYIAARADAAKVAPRIASYRHVDIIGNHIFAPNGGDCDGIRGPFLEDDVQVIWDVHVESNRVIWGKRGGPNSSAVVMGSPKRNPNMQHCSIARNHFENTNYGMYLQGFVSDAEPMCSDNNMVGVTTPSHRE